MEYVGLYVVTYFAVTMSAHFKMNISELLSPRACVCASQGMTHEYFLVQVLAQLLKGWPTLI